MKTALIGIAVLLLIQAYVPIPKVQAETLPPVIISEIQIAGDNTANDDFIELYNPGDAIISLKGWHLCRRTKSNIADCKSSSNSIKAFSSADNIAPKTFLLWVNGGGKKYIDIADIKTTDSLTDNNSLALFDDKDVLIDSVTWGTGHTLPFSPSPLLSNPTKNKSHTRNPATLLWEENALPTPTNSQGKTYEPPLPDPPPSPPPSAPPKTYSIRLNELLPNPSAKGDAGEFIELYNFGNTDEDVSGWIIRDATKTGKYVFPPESNIKAQTYFLITDQTFKISLNNTSETISLFDVSNILVDSMRYEKTREDISLNYTPSGWRGGTPTPGTLNQINNLPEVKEKVPKKGYRGTSVEFRAKGEDADGDTLKYVWDFGDGHKSYKGKTSHIYQQNGTYTVTLKTTDGQEDLLETFTIEIRSLTYPKLRITALMPNPAGKDTDNEWVMLENQDKKAVNLKGFGIATGWKNLVNHPVRENFIIKPKQELKLTRANSLFTLTNQKGKVELRAPDGKVLQKIKYKPEKSLADNIVYKKTKGTRWSFEITETEDVDSEKNAFSVSPTEPPSNEDSAPTNDTSAIPESPDDPSAEKEVLGASITEPPTNQDVRDRQWLRLISLGTDTAPPEDIGFTYHDSNPGLARQALSLIQETFFKFNAYLNNIRNAPSNE